MTIFANCVALAVYTPYPCNDSNTINGYLVSKIYLNLNCIRCFLQNKTKYIVFNKIIIVFRIELNVFF